MNRRSFLALALTSCTLGMVGCGPSSAAPSAAAEAATPRAAALAAPPLAVQPHPINDSTVRLPSRLEIPAIDVDIPVVELGWSQQENRAGQIFSEWDVAAYAAGWHKNSALPGEGGNVVMSGHNNILGAVFRELDQLKRGDTITVWAGAHLYTYAVDQVVVLPDKSATEEQRILNSGWIGPFDEERLTLVSCWPRNNNTHRIVIVARPSLTAHSSR
ncbi:MAG: sortase [Caldilineaceae bacterium]|nr:sortase [Caldilineaceae bacterium]